ncbi:MAG: NUDIX domain-containing protein [Bacteroides sp.]|nr:NUDIX domain-containing protein [Bacteroides sp.]
MDDYTIDIITPYTADDIHPGFSVDCVIFSFHKKKLHVLLNKFMSSNLWQLPGGFMLKKEDADQAANRILRTWTGLTDIYLKQFYLFSDPNRVKMNQNRDLSSMGYGGEWLMQRYVSLGYYALVKYNDVKIDPQKSKTTKWYDINQLPSLYSDHENIIQTALKTIKGLLAILPIGQALLPEKFTLSELRKIYEIISDKTLDRRNFQRKVLASGLVIPLNETKESKYNPAVLYSFNKDNDKNINYSTFL